MDSARDVHEKRMRQLASQPHTEVLEYSYDEAERDALPAVCVGLARRVVEARRHVDPALSDAQAGRVLCASDPIFAQFSRTHPRIFACMLNAQTCGRSLCMLEQLARIRQSVVEGEMGEAEANVHANRIVMEKTMRDPTDEEKRTLVLDGTSSTGDAQDARSGDATESTACRKS